MTGTVKVTVAMPGYNPLAEPGAREEYIQTLRREGRISAELEHSIRENLPITAAKRQEVIEAKYRALADNDWIQRHKRGGQVEKSEFTEWKGWLGRPVQG
jgi:hypothetical protein